MEGGYSICLALWFWIRVLRGKEGSGGVKKEARRWEEDGGKFWGTAVAQSGNLQSSSPGVNRLAPSSPNFSSFLSAPIPIWFGQVRLSFSNKQSVSTILHSTPSSRAARPAQQIAL
jgi:hypothetical protein